MQPSETHETEQNDGAEPWRHAHRVAARWNQGAFHRQAAEDELRWPGGSTPLTLWLWPIVWTNGAAMHHIVSIHMF